MSTFRHFSDFAKNCCKSVYTFCVTPCLIAFFNEPKPSLTHKHGCHWRLFLMLGDVLSHKAGKNDFFQHFSTETTNFLMYTQFFFLISPHGNFGNIFILRHVVESCNEVWHHKEECFHYLALIAT